LLLLPAGPAGVTAVAGSKTLHQSVGSDDKKIIVYDGLYHEIFNEPERVAVMTDMRDWLDAQLRKD